MRHQHSLFRQQQLLQQTFAALSLLLLVTTCNGFSTSLSFGYRPSSSPSEATRSFTSHSSSVRDVNFFFPSHHHDRLSSLSSSHPSKTVLLSASIDETTTTTTTTTAVTAAELLDDETVEAIAGRLEGMIRIPLIPGPLVNLAWTKVVERMTKKLDSNLMNEIQIMLDAEATSTRADDVKIADVQNLSKRIAADMRKDGALELPYLNEKQEVELLEKITEGMLRILTVRKTERRLKGINISIDLSKQLLDSTETRQRLADRLNERIDIPVLQEDVEGQLLLQSVERASGVLATLLPPQLVSALLQDQNPRGLDELKTHLVDRMMSLVHLPDAARPFQQALVDNMVELVMEDMFGNKGELFLMNWQEQRDFYQERRALYQKQLMLGQQTFQEEQAHLRQQIEMISKRIEGLNEKLRTTLEP